MNNTAAYSVLSAIADKGDYLIFGYETLNSSLVYVNPAFKKMFEENGFYPSGRGLWNLVHPEDYGYVKEGYSELLQTGKKCLEFRVILNKKEHWLCVNAFLLDEASGLIAGYAEDISRHKEYTANLLKFSNKKNSMLNILSHDLAVPLGSIQNLSAILSQKVKNYENEEINNFIRQISRISHQSIRLIKDLIQQEFVESAGVDLLKKRINIVEALKEIMDQYRQSEQEIKKTFRFLYSREVIYVEIDETKLLQAVNNLLSNAIKFTHDNGTITLQVEEKDESVLIQVEDDGVGIPEKFHKTLFNKFNPASRPGLKGEPSIGLGMSIIKNVSFGF